MTFPFSQARTRAFLATAVLIATAVATGGCTMSQEELLKLPTLADVTPTGPKGKKCYDRCSHAEASCRHMCPKSEGLCQEDCVMDTKFCLSDCPELLDHTAPPSE
ncbi:MAG: hypothetical protein ABR587_01655 [Candidatus Binatia bacterium]